MTSRRLLHAALAAWMCLAAGAAGAAAFGVSPLRVDLDRGARTGLVNVSNDEDRRLSFELKLFAWTQGEGGEDAYAPSDDLVFFPRILTIDPKARRSVRIGIRGALPAGEKAYRLYIEEMPDPAAAAAGGTGVAVRLRFGLPIFVAGAEGEPAISIREVRADKGHVVALVHNSGARTARFEQLVATSGGKVVGNLNGWYVFPGVTREFRIPVSKEACPLGGVVEVSTQLAGKDVRGQGEASPVLCAP